MNIVLVIIFFVIALLYSSIGFGGGSSYIAFLFLFKIPYMHIPIISLFCNMIVVTGGAFHYLKNKQISLGSVFPFIITSVPAAYLGGLIHIDKTIFKFVLGTCLFLAGVKMIVKINNSYDDFKLPSFFSATILGAGLGFISGLVGIGGGIFLSPIMYFLKWGKPKEIAATCSLFILFNSIAGLVGQAQKFGPDIVLYDYLPLILAVFIGGQIGSYLGSNKIKPRYIEIITSILVLLVSVRILFFS